MTSQKRRAAGRRRAWGRGPIILRFEPLEDRALMTAAAATPPQPLPDLVGADFATAHALDWGDSFHAVGTVLNQGDAPTNAPFNVEVFASTTPSISATSVPLGEVTIPAGLAPGQTSKFDQVFSMPATPVSGYNAGDPIYIASYIDPEKAIAESNEKNNSGVGQGYDVSPVAITPHQPSLLIGSSLGINPTQATWGQTITVTAQVRNNAQGDAPPTRARVILTPSGLNPGSAYDYTIGYLNVPAVPAWQTVNVSQQITLPSAPPSSLNSGTSFTLSMAQDADFVTDPLYPHLPDQGTGLDQTPITITANPNASNPADPTTAAQPDLAPANVNVLTPKAVFWGYDFQVSTTVQNLGKADSGPVDVRFLLTGSDGSLTQAIYLGDTVLPSLKAGTTQDITQTVHLPSVLPDGVSIPSTTTGRIAVLVDPDHAIDETLRSNDLAESSPVTLRVLGTDGSSKVPTSPPVSTTLGSPQPAGTVQSTTPTSTATGDTPAPAATTPKAPKHKPRAPRLPARATRAQAILAARQAAASKLRRHVAPPKQSLTQKIEHGLKVFPDNVKNFVNDLIHGNPVNSPSSSKKK